MMLKYARRVTVFESVAAEISPINPAGAQGFGKTQGEDAEEVLHRTGMFKLHWPGVPLGQIPGMDFQG